MWSDNTSARLPDDRQGEVVSERNGSGRDVGLVLGGGGARGAYTSGALSVLLPELKEQVRVIVGTSAGGAGRGVSRCQLASSCQGGDRGRAELLARFAIRGRAHAADGGWRRDSVYALRRRVPARQHHPRPSLLHPEPLPQTLEKLVDFDQLGENIREQRLALGVVAAPAYGNRSVVFHQGGMPRHREDRLRGIEYVATPRLELEHILASSAIPTLFPAVRVTTPEPAAGWYYDGGSRLNTPIKPALWLGAKRVIVIALNSVAPSCTPAPEHQPDFYIGAAHLLHAALGDPLAQDIRTLANTNALIAAGLTATNGRSRNHRPTVRRRQPGGLAEPVQPVPVQPVPYIFIAPEDPSAIGEIARRVYRKHYGRPWKAGARDLWLLGKILDASADAMHGELLSYLFFAGEFAEELIKLGQADAQRWIDEHPADLWQLDPLPAWNPAPNDDLHALNPPRLAPVRPLAPAGEPAAVTRERSDGVG